MKNLSIKVESEYSLYVGKPQNVSPGMIESIKIFTTNFYDSGEQDDVPRISIPDEGSEESISHMVRLFLIFPKYINFNAQIKTK